MVSALFAPCAAAAAEGPVIVKGSNTFGEELGPALIDAYRAAHPDAAVSLESHGSDTGLAALFAGTCDIATSSRRVTDDERRLARSRGLKLKVYLVGFYGVAVIVHRENPVNDLTDSQVRDLFTGRVTNWKEVGGPDLPVHRCIRDPPSGTYLGFQELAMERLPYAPEARRLPRYADIAAAVAQDKGAIGYVSMPVADSPGIRAVRINRVPISVLTVNDEDYPYARAVRFVTFAGHEPKGAVDFIHFALSPAGQKVLAATGFVGRFEQPLISPEL